MRTWLWAAMAGLAGWASQPVRAGSASFIPAYIEPATKPIVLILFPLDGPEIAVLLPAELPHIEAPAFSRDGKAIYGSAANFRNPSSGRIYKIEFHPARASVIPAPAEIGHVFCLAASPSTGRIVVFGMTLQGGARIFEIDPAAGTNRPLPDGAPSSCGGSGGFLSPDGKQVIRKDGKQLDLSDLKTGMSRAITAAAIDASCTWSPNGQSIACDRNGEIAVIDANDPSRQRNLVAGTGPVKWSPDSKYLLFRTSQPSCLLTLDYSGGLEVLDADTAKRTSVKSSRCRVGGGAYGWIDSTVAIK